MQKLRPTPPRKLLPLISPFFKNLMDFLQKNLKISIVLLVGILGQFFNFIGLCVVQSGLNSKATGTSIPNPLGLGWFFLCFYVFYFVFVVLTTIHDSTITYRFLLLALTAVSLTFIPLEIQSAVAFTPVDYIRGGAIVKTLGLVILFFACLVLLFLYGTEKDSIFHTTEFSSIPMFSFSPKSKDVERPASQPYSTPQVAFQPSSAYQLDSPKETAVLPSPAPRNSGAPVLFKAQALYACKNFILTRR